MARKQIGNTGLFVETTTGVIDGTPKVSGNIVLNVTASNNYGTDTKTLTIAVSAAPVVPVVPLVETTREKRIAAVKLANQATFGASESIVNEIIAKAPDAMAAREAWVIEQLMLPDSDKSVYGRQEQFQVHSEAGNVGNYCYGTGGGAGIPNCERLYYSSNPVRQDFFLQAISGKDQLRMRVAHLLSQIFVISNTDLNGLDREFATYGLARFQQMLRDNAFGNYRNILKSVTLSPQMGQYLDLVNNSKNSPNENFGRELLQLFSIGTSLLNTDGTTVPDAPPPYDNGDVREYAYALTGWTYPPGGNQIPGVYTPPTANPMFFAGNMVPWADKHDQNQRQLLGNTIVPAGSTAESALELVLDSVMNHQNVGPFVCLRLIRNLVTSNPSSGYVTRVVNAFNTGRFTTPKGVVIGTGSKGDMAATTAAILLDTEAASPASANSPTFGKLREPILFMTGLVRALNGASDGEYFGRNFIGSQMEQAVFNSPTVFNYYFLDGIFNGGGSNTRAPMGAYAGPEFTITSTNASASRINFIYDMFFSWNSNLASFGFPGSIGTQVHADQLADNFDDDALIDRLDVLLTAGQMTADHKTCLKTLLNSNPYFTSADKVKAVFVAVGSSALFQTQV